MPINFSYLFHSFIHSLKNDAMIRPSQCALDIERATEASVTLILQLVALASGIFQHDDYLINFTTLSGMDVKFINQRKEYSISIMFDNDLMYNGIT